MGIGLFLAAMDQTIVVAGTSYASIGSELEQLQRTTWIATAYMLTVTSFQPLYGKLCNIFGRKPVLLCAYGIFALGSLCCGLARTMDELIFSRALAGVGGGGMTTIVSIILSDIVPLRLRGKWQGYVNIIYTCGSISGAPIGGVVADSIGWRWAFLIQTLPCLGAMLVVAFYLDLPGAQDHSSFLSKIKRIDYLGSITLIASILSLLVAFDHGGNISWSDSVTLISIGTLFLSLSLFIIVENYLASEPIASMNIIFNKSFLGAYLSNFFGVSVMMTVFFYAPIYLQAVKQQSASMTSLWLVFTVLAGLSGSLGSGFIMQATGKFYAISVISYTMLIGGAACLLLSTGVFSHSAAGVAVGLTLVSLGNVGPFFNKGAGTTSTLIALVSNAGHENQAMATATSYLFRSLGSVLGVAFGNNIEQQVLRTTLRNLLDVENIDEIIRRSRESLSYINTLEPVLQEKVRNGYSVAVQAIMTVGYGINSVQKIIALRISFMDM
ncbi:hypothetical protein NP233_g6067 [Leucocoprinus birnbaumii]|uniref:Major facilitator superfamily (MFS) profile domain-containing protein n=1 Tax=Leucocoprinus birnbaumii TaxID=56174 RepID=A0AAD5YW44_9AGAR|nr:hypothetical protein NP233_g6067 [Leucocoprinus birnbaumii]